MINRLIIKSCFNFSMLLIKRFIGLFVLFPWLSCLFTQWSFTSFTDSMIHYILARWGRGPASRRGLALCSTTLPTPIMYMLRGHSGVPLQQGAFRYQKKFRNLTIMAGTNSSYVTRLSMILSIPIPQCLFWVFLLPVPARRKVHSVRFANRNIAISIVWGLRTGGHTSGWKGCFPVTSGQGMGFDCGFYVLMHMSQTVHLHLKAYPPFLFLLGYFTPCVDNNDLEGHK